MNPQNTNLPDEKPRPPGTRRDLANFTQEDFFDWLEPGLSAYFLENKGSWAFPGAEGILVRHDYLSRGLQEVYQGLPAIQQGYFRQVLSKILAALEPSERMVPIFEHLLSLAALLPAREVLRVLPGKVGNGFFGRFGQGEDRNLFSLTLLTVARLAVQWEEAETCLHDLIGSRYFVRSYAGIALVALCRVNPGGLVQHLEKLRQLLLEKFTIDKTAGQTKRNIANNILDAVSLPILARALPELRYLDDKDITDRWLLEALLRGKDAPLRKKWEKGRIFLYRRGQEAITEPLPDNGSALGDLLEYLNELDRKPTHRRRQTHESARLRSYNFISNKVSAHP